VSRRDAYELLGVERGADERQIKKRFRVLARELHPDVNSEPDAEERFKEAAEAYEVLSDPERRQVYDRYGWEGLDSRGYAPHAHGFGSFADIFDAFFGGDPFGGRAGSAGPGPVQGGDIGVETEITLGQAAQGASVEVSFDAVETCERCHGNRAEPGTPIEACQTCGGTGQLNSVSRTAFGQLVRSRACDACRGEGKVATTPCAECHGEGRRATRRTLELDIPAGIADGQRVRLTGRGHAGDRGGPAGDLYVLVRVVEDERFVRDGSDLVSVVDVPAPAAALGTTITVATLDGDEDLEIAAGTQPGTVVTLRGLGMPQIGRSRRGDQRVVLNVVIPRNLDARQRELLTELEGSLTEANLSEPRHESLVDKVRRALR
jgi:molecular chaperone DnaJ